MEKQWYLSRDRNVFGPVTDVQLAQAVAAGRVLPTDLLNELGQANWVLASAVPGLFPLPVAVEEPPIEAELIEEPVVADLIEEPVIAARVVKVTCFACFREVSIEIRPGVPTAHCPRCRAAIETGETANGPVPATAHQAAFGKLESPAAFKARMQQKVAAAEAAAARDGAILGGLLGGILPPS